MSHVYNFDAPWHPDDYVHRIGRTGRAGATGIAYTLVTPDDAENIAEIEKLTGMKIERVKPASANGDTAREEAPEKREAAPRRGRGRKTEAEPRPKAEPVAAEAAPEPEARAPREAEPRREAAPRRERGGRGRSDDRPEPRRQSRGSQDEPDDGWNGPVPDFLKYTLGA